MDITEDRYYDIQLAGIQADMALAIATCQSAHHRILL